MVAGAVRWIGAAGVVYRPSEFFNPYVKPVNETLLLLPFEHEEADLF